MKKIAILLIALLLVTLPLLAACSSDDDTDTQSSGTETTAKKEFTLKLAHSATEDSERGKMAQLFADLVKEKTNGRVEVKIYPNGMLYGVLTEWDALATGAIDVNIVSATFRLGQAPWSMITIQHEFWENIEHAHNWVVSPEANALWNDSTEPKGVHHLGMLDQTFYLYYFNSKREVKTYQSHDGLRFAARPGMSISYLQKYMGVVNVEVPQEEMFTALATGLVDSIAITPSLGVTSSVWDFGAKHVFKMPFGPACALLQMNLDKWNKLPADIQDIINNEVMPELVDFAYELMVEGEKADEATVRERVDTFNTATPEDRAALVEASIANDSMHQAVQKMAGPEIVELIESLKPSNNP